jgi:hypothetical protein
MTLLYLSSLAVALSNEEIQQIMVDQMGPAALLRQAFSEYWVAYLLAVVAAIQAVWESRTHPPVRASAQTSGWQGLPFFVWGIVAVRPTTMSHLGHPVFLKVHILVASTALVMLLSATVASRCICTRAGAAQLSAPWKDLLVSVVIVTVFLDLFFFLVFS